ncbi:SCO4848 family membrane protein [Sphaerisporangium aureirubrum]|uniref:SCO4848 family membrane protein n=1 Tax=Sphaerisporangium aureirubrum TaxID=1544736 RepID=A0ABW1NCR8_9ACTN
MTRRVAGFLLVLAAFMVFEWINLGFNLADGHPTAFYVVHGVLIAVNLILAGVLGVLGWRAWRSAGRQAAYEPPVVGRDGKRPFYGPP